MDASPVKQWRQDHDILQKDLAAEMGMSPSTLSQKENGHLDWNRSDLAFLKQEKRPFIRFCSRFPEESQ